MIILNWAPAGGRHVVEAIEDGRLVAMFFDMCAAQSWAKGE